MEEEYDKEKSAALIKEAQAITAGLRSEIGELQTQMSRVLGGDQMDAGDVDESKSEPREVRGEQVAIATTIVKDVDARKPFWRFWG